VVSDAGKGTREVSGGDQGDRAQSPSGDHCWRVVTRSASREATSASTMGRRATWCSGSPISTAARTASGSSSTGTPTSLLQISGIPPPDRYPRPNRHSLRLLSRRRYQVLGRADQGV